MPKTEIREQKDLVLPKNAGGVTISWKSSNRQIITDDGSVHFPSGNGQTKVKLTATLKKGNATDTRDFTVTVYHKDNSGGQNEKPAVDLSNGGIAGTMQQPKPWDVDTIKWTNADAAAGVYEYQFAASADTASWKVVAVRGNWNSGAYLGAVVNAGSGDAELKYDNKSGVGVNCETGGLEVGKTYKIVVTVKDGKVFASVETM